MKKEALISECGKYCYRLSRIWDTTLPRLVFIGLNPSTADDKIDDLTITRCINYSNDWGFGGFYMVNLFAYRTSEPKEMKKAKDPIGPDNDEIIQKTVQAVETVLLMWGNNGDYLKRDKEVLSYLPKNKLFCLEKSNHGNPKHLLYLSKELEPIKF